MCVETWVRRGKGRMVDLSADYEDLSAGVQGLGYLESGITDPLTRFEGGLLDFAGNIRDNVRLSFFGLSWAFAHRWGWG